MGDKAKDQDMGGQADPAAALAATEKALEVEMGKVAALTTERDGLASQLVEVRADRDRASDAVGSVQRERDELTAELAKLGVVLVPFDQANYPWPPEAASDVDKILLIIAQATAAQGKYDQLEADYAEVTRQRDDHAKTIATLRAEPRVQKGPKPPQPRKAGPMKPGDGDADALADALFLRLSAAAHTVIFSDGRNELPIAPIIVAAGAWARVPAGIMLREPHTIKPETAVTLAGFALLDEDGKQIGWSGLMTPQRIPAGQEAKLDRQIVF